MRKKISILLISILLSLTSCSPIDRMNWGMTEATQIKAIMELRAMHGIGTGIDKRKCLDYGRGYGGFSNCNY